jgi:uncharacterized membrane protein YoaK (UPF0700 family)
MIDKLIASDFAALAAEDRQAIPPKESWFRPPPEAKPRRTWRIRPALPIVIAGAAAGTLYEENFTAAHLAPQLAIALALVVMALVGFAGDASRSRPLAPILTAGLFSLVATIGFTAEWHLHQTNCLFVDDYSVATAPCLPGRFVTTTWFAVGAWCVTVLIATFASRLIRRRGPDAWQVASKLITAAVLLTWTGLNQYVDLSIDLIRFHYAPYVQMGAARISFDRVHVYAPDVAGWIRATSDRGQWNAIEAGLVGLVLAISIGIACTRDAKRPSRWLRLLESPFVLPLAVIAASVSLVLATAQFELFQQHRGDPDDIPWYAALASIGAVVAYASMLLRRRRREALS